MLSPADDPKLIYSVYAIAFVPLAYIYALDFISSKWRSIRETRHSGMIQLFISLPSLGYVVYYIQLQIENNDHKEAAAGMTVLVFNVYHTLRTIWGLIQLYEFMNWNVYALKRLLKLGYSAPVYDYSKEIKDTVSEARESWQFWKRSTFVRNAYSWPRGVVNERYFGLSRILPSLRSKVVSLYKWILGRMDEEEEELLGVTNMTVEAVRRTIDYHMVVNSSLIDNEFGNSQLPVRPVITSRLEYTEVERPSLTARIVGSVLKSKKPEECSVRWLVSFLAKFGHSWIADTRRLSAKDSGSEERKSTDSSRNLALLAALHTTKGSILEKGSTERFATPLSPFHKFCIYPESCRDSEVEITEHCMLPFKMRRSNIKKYDFSRHEATIKDAVKDDWHKASLNMLEDSKREAVENMTSAQLACFSTLMEQDLNFCEDDEFYTSILTAEKSSDISWDNDDPRIDTVLYQLGCQGSTDYDKFFEEIPLRKECMDSFLWSRNQNRLLLQTSAHIDNCIALESGDVVDAYMKEFLQIASPAISTSVFQQQYDLELGALRNNVLREAEHTTSIEIEGTRFIGCVAESVRSILAEWVEAAHPEPAGWEASIAPLGLRFRCSNQLGAVFHELKNKSETHTPRHVRSLYMRLVWEIQCYLQWNLAEASAREEQDIRTSPFLIMLFLLGFPSLKIQDARVDSCLVVEDEGNQNIAFQKKVALVPVGGPQIIKIIVLFDEDSNTLSAELCTEDLLFNWQSWKDAFMGRLSVQNHWRKSRLSSSQEHLCEEANYTIISAPVERVTPTELGIDYELVFWSGWPPHVPRISQFEVRKLINYFGARQSWRPSYENCGPNLYILYIEFLNAALTTVSQTRSVVDAIYEDGKRALKEGREDDALKIFGRCVADYGHRGALRDAINLLRHMSSVRKDQVYGFFMHMKTWYKVLLNGNNAQKLSNHGEKIDLAMLGNYFGRLHKLTGNKYALKFKALALFHKSGVQDPVCEEAIRTMESFFTQGSYAVDFNVFLAVAYQSLYHVSRNPVQRQLAAKHLLGLGTHGSPTDIPHEVSIGYLLEKGYFCQRSEVRKNVVLNYYCERQDLGTAKRLRAMFTRLFVKSKESGSDKSELKQAEVGDGVSAFGIGTHPGYAIEVYKAVVSKDYTSHEGYAMQAFNRLGMLYHKGAGGILPNISLAAEQYLKAMTLGSKEALCNMGVLKLLNNSAGDGVAYFEKAAEAHKSIAMNNIAVAYELGIGVQRDAPSAERLYRLAIQIDGNPIALCNLAVMYKWGDPRIRSEGNSAQLVSKLLSGETDMSGLYFLQSQIFKLANSVKVDMKVILGWKIELEEIDDCLAFLNCIES